MQALVIATKTGKCLPVMLESINQYVPKDVVVYLSGYEYQLPYHNTVISENPYNNFGDSFNAVVHQAFQKHEEIIVCNDDIVLTPISYQLLKEDVEQLKRHTEKLGWVTSRADYVRGHQNIRVGKKRSGVRFDEEYCIEEVPVIAPLFAYISKEAWVDFKPINWYSDDIQCYEMLVKGYRHFISRSYVHHVGSQTIGLNNDKNHIEAKEWIDKNMPEFSEEFFK